MVGGVGAALSIGTPCWRGAVVAAPVGGEFALSGVLRGERGSRLRRQETSEIKHLSSVSDM